MFFRQLSRAVRSWWIYMSTRLTNVTHAARNFLYALGGWIGLCNGPLHRRLHVRVLKQMPMAALQGMKTLMLQNIPGCNLKKATDGRQERRGAGVTRETLSQSRPGYNNSVNKTGIQY